MNQSDIREQKIDTLNELISVTRNSAEFYGEAAGRVDNPQLQSLFRNMADAKSGIAESLSREVKGEGGTPKESGGFQGSLQRVYGEARAKLGGDDYAYVAQLEASEDRMLDAYRKVVRDEDTPQAVRTAVSEYLPQVTEQHNLMRDRKWMMDGDASRH